MAQKVNDAKEQRRDVANIAAGAMDRFILGDRMPRDDMEGLGEFLVAVRDLKMRQDEWHSPPCPSVEKAALCVQTAKDFSEKLALCEGAKQWLNEISLAHVAEVLHHADLMDRLYEMKGRELLLSGIGLSARPREAILIAAARDDITGEEFTSLKVPPRWERTPSRSTGLYYSKEVGGPSQQ